MWVNTNILTWELIATVTWVNTNTKLIHLRGNSVVQLRGLTQVNTNTLSWELIGTVM